MTIQPERLDSPRIVVPPACAEICRKLRERAYDATAQMRENSASPLVVICEHKKRIGCGAYAIQFGLYAEFGEDNTQVLLPDPVSYEGSGSVGQMIAKAIEHGAVEIDTLKPL